MNTDPSVRASTKWPTSAKVGGAIVGTVVFLAVFAPLVARTNPTNTTTPFLRPTRSHILGTDDAGHDLWANLVYGARISVFVGIATGCTALLLALMVSLSSVYRRGWFEAISLRIIDLTLGLPFLIVVLVVSVFIGRSAVATIAVLSLVLWARPARVLRASALRIRDAPHVQVAMASGASGAWIIRRHLLDRIAPQAVAQFVRLVNLAVLTEASLAFLGLGDPGQVSWGTTLYFANARSAFLTGAWTWWVLPPALGLTMLSCGLALIGFAVEERSDPRLRTANLGAVHRVARPDRFYRMSRGRRADVTSTTKHVTSPLQGQVVTIRDVVVDYDQIGIPVRAVNGVGLEIDVGHVVGLIGESGCGKSSLASAVMGMIASPGHTTSGTIHFGSNGERSADLTDSASVAALRGRLVALIPQSSMNALNPSQRIIDQTIEAAEVAGNHAGRSSRERANAALSSVLLSNDERERFAHQLSGGQRQRAVMAMAMVNEPCLVIADEATSGLDPLTQNNVLRVLMDRCVHHSCGLLLISHDLSLIGRFADRIAVMYAGRIVEEGPTESLLQSPNHPYTAALLNAYPSIDGISLPASIPGDVPDLAALPQGCAFQSRCSHAVAQCTMSVPPLVPTGSRSVACFVRSGT